MNLIDFYVLILIVYSKSLMLWEIYLFHICIAVLFFPSVADRFIVFHEIFAWSLCDVEVEHSVL